MVGKTAQRRNGATAHAPRLTRRSLLGGAALLATALAGCGEERPARWGGRFLTVVTTGGALRQSLFGAIFDLFRRATGCRVQDISLPVGDILRELRRQALVGQRQWDAVVLDAPHAALAARETPGLFATEGAIFAVDTLALAYRTGPLGERAPTTWDEVWSGDVPGVRLWPEDPVGLLEIALLADGIAPGDLYPLDLDRAFASLDRLRVQAPIWWRLSARAGSALTFGEADLALAYGGELRAAVAAGAIATVAPLPTPLLPLTLNLPQRTPNGDVARDFAAFVRDTAVQEALHAQGYGTTGALSPSAFPLDVGWWREAGGEALARFDRWRAGSGQWEGQRSWFVSQSPVG